MNTPLLDVQDLKKYFPVRSGLLRRVVGHVHAVDEISLQIMPGETLALVGESGCGKTTAARTMVRLLDADGGRILFRGQDITHLEGDALRRMRRHMQVVFQDPYASLNPRRTVGEIIGAPMVLHGLATASDVNDKMRDLLVQVGLQPDYLSRYPHEFSGGQRQRIGIARALALEPELVMCDEAVSALDVSVQAQIINLLADLQAGRSMSYLFVAHNLSVVRHVAHRVAVMYLGRLVEVAPTAELFEDPRHPYTQALLAAMPKAHPVRPRRSFVRLGGEVPSPVSPPSGCHLHPRCPVAEARCKTLIPALVAVNSCHIVRCVKELPRTA